MNRVLHGLTKITTGIATVITLSAGRAMALTVQEGAEAARGDGMPAELLGDTGVFTRIVNIILYVVGIVSVIMLIYGGLRYVLSGGDSKKVTDAKNTILYAIIGLIISILSFAIVNFVLNNIGISDKNYRQNQQQEQQEQQQEQQGQ